MCKEDTVKEIISKTTENLIGCGKALYGETISLAEYDNDCNKIMDEFWDALNAMALSGDEIESYLYDAVDRAVKESGFALISPCDPRVIGKDKVVLEYTLALLGTFLTFSPEIPTGFGMADPKSGYKLSSIRFAGNFVLFEVYLLDRSIKSNDMVRNGDMAYLKIEYVFIKDKIIYGDMEVEK